MHVSIEFHIHILWKIGLNFVMWYSWSENFFCYFWYDYKHILKPPQRIFFIYWVTTYCFLRPYNVIIHVSRVNSYYHKKFPHVFMHNECAKQIKPNCNHEYKVSINFHFNNIFIFERIHRIPFSACLTKFEWSNTQPV